MPNPLMIQNQIMIQDLQAMNPVRPDLNPHMIPNNLMILDQGVMVPGATTPVNQSPAMTRGGKTMTRAQEAMIQEIQGQGAMTPDQGAMMQETPDQRAMTARTPASPDPPMTPDISMILNHSNRSCR